MRARTLLLLVAAAALALPATSGAADYDLAALEQAKAAVPENEENLAKGLELYAARCAWCHGDKGLGDGLAAPSLWPRPRDFQLGLFKFRSTNNGELPTDADLFRTISRGVQGTAMPAWGEGAHPLSEEERWQLVWAVKSLAEYADFTSDDFDPYRPDAAAALSEQPPIDDALLELGRAIYGDENRGGCQKCHGKAGRGDGKGDDLLHDDWGDAIVPQDLTTPRRIKNGETIFDIYRTLTTGLNGTPMPSFTNSIDDRERWAVAAYVASLQEPAGDDADVLLLAPQVADAPPTDPADPFWTEQPRIEIPVTGQVVVAPRHQNQAVDRVFVRAAHGGGRLAVHLTWHDRTASTTPAEHADPDATGAPYLAARDHWDRFGTLPDGISLQLPKKAPDGPVKPHFYRGGPAGGVNLWTWSAATDAAVEQDSRGWDKLPQDQPEAGQELQSASAFEDGRWTVVMSRPLATADGAKDLDLAPGMLVPIALQVWDGGQGETPTECGLTSWYYLQLDAATPTAGYAFSALAAGGGLGLVLLAVGRARRLEDPTPAPPPEASS